MLCVLGRAWVLLAGGERREEPNRWKAKHGSSDNGDPSGPLLRQKVAWDNSVGRGALLPADDKDCCTRH